VQRPCHKQRQNCLKQVTLGQGVRVLPAGKRFGTTACFVQKKPSLTTDIADNTDLHGSKKVNLKTIFE
jgi:hypothetical protein